MPDHPPGNPPSMSDLAFAALKRAGRRVAMEAKEKGTKIAIWRDGRVVVTLVDEIPPFDEWDLPPPPAPRQD